MEYHYIFDIMNSQLRLLRVSIEMKERLTSALPQEIFSTDPSGDLEKLVTSPTEPDINCVWQTLYQMETQQNTRSVSKYVVMPFTSTIESQLSPWTPWYTLISWFFSTSPALWWILGATYIRFSAPGGMCRVVKGSRRTGSAVIRSRWRCNKA